MTCWRNRANCKLCGPDGVSCHTGSLPPTSSQTRLQAEAIWSRFARMSSVGEPLQRREPDSLCCLTHYDGSLHPVVVHAGVLVGARDCERAGECCPRVHVPRVEFRRTARHQGGSYDLGSAVAVCPHHCVIDADDQSKCPGLEVG